MTCLANLYIPGTWLARIGCEGKPTLILRPTEIEQNRPFSSPKGEQAWAVKNGHEYWLFPNWELDISSQKDRLRKAGYSCFVMMHEPIPRKVRMKPRQGVWNWKIGLQ